jgi:hypothetical protein
MRAKRSNKPIDIITHPLNCATNKHFIDSPRYDNRQPISQGRSANNRPNSLITTPNADSNKAAKIRSSSTWCAVGRKSMTKAPRPASAMMRKSHVISSRHEKQLHLSRASIAKYVPGEVRPPPPKFRGGTTVAPFALYRESNRNGEILCGLRHLSLRLEWWAHWLLLRRHRPLLKVCT